MKKKIIILISVVLIILTIIAVIFVIKNNRSNNLKPTGNIDPETFYALTKFEIDDEEKVQIVHVHNPTDASFVYWYNFDFNKKSVIELYRSTNHLDTKDHYEKREYQLTDKNIEDIKEKLEKLKSFSNDELDFSLELKDRMIMKQTEYRIITKEGNKTFYDNYEAIGVIHAIITIMHSSEI